MMKREITLMKNQISTVMNLLGDQIIDIVGFLSNRIAQQDVRLCSRLKFRPDMLKS